MTSLEHHHNLTPVIPRIVPPLYEDVVKWLAWGKQQTRSLLARLTPAAAHEVLCIGDGNCFFRAVSLQVFGTQDRHPEVRRDVVAYMRANPTTVVEWMSEDIQFHEYCNAMARPFSDIVDEIPLYIVSVLYRNTLVVVDGSDGYGWYKVIPGPPGSSDHLFFVYRNENHYNACAPTPRITTVTPAVDTSEAVLQLETRKRFTASLHVHVRSLMQAGYSAFDLSLLNYQSSTVRDGVFAMVDANAPQREASVRQCTAPCERRHPASDRPLRATPPCE